MRRIFAILLSIFALSSAYAQSGDANYYHISTNGLGRSSGAVTVGFLGGETTISGEWSDEVSSLLTERFPDADFTFINAGNLFAGSVAAAFRAEDDLYAVGTPDILFVDVTADDRAVKEVELNQRKAVEGIIRKALRRNSNMDIIFLYTPDSLMLEEYAAGEEPQGVAIAQEFVEFYNLSSVNLAAMTAKEGIDASLYASKIFNAVEMLDEVVFTEKKRAKTPKAIDKNCFDAGRLIDTKEAELVPMFTYYESYQLPDDGVEKMEGFDNIPMIIGEKSGVSMLYKFKGTAFGIAAISGPDSGMIDSYLNNSDRVMFDVFTEGSDEIHKPRYLILRADAPSGYNYISVRILQTKNGKSTGNKLRVFKFMVNDCE